LTKGKGYFYWSDLKFDPDNTVHHLDSTSVLAYAINSDSWEGWMGELKYIVKKRDKENKSIKSMKEENILRKVIRQVINEEKLKQLMKKHTSSSLVKILNEVSNIHVGYPDIYYYDDNRNVIGYITYEKFENIPHIDYIHVEDGHRGERIAYKMLKALQAEYPNEGIDFGYLTGDGKRMYDKLKFKTIVNKQYLKIEKKLKDTAKQMDYEKKHNFPHGDLWNELSNLTYDLETELHNTWKIKKILK